MSVFMALHQTRFLEQPKLKNIYFFLRKIFIFSEENFQNFRISTIFLYQKNDYCENDNDRL